MKRFYLFYLFLFLAGASQAQWNRIHTTIGGKVNDLLVYEDKILAATDGGIYVSDTGIISWNYIDHSGLNIVPPLNSSVTLLATSDAIYSMSESGNIHRSDDKGASWTQLGFTAYYGSRLGSTFTQINDTLYAVRPLVDSNGTQIQPGLYRSVDKGNTFTRIKTVDGALTIAVYSANDVLFLVSYKFVSGGVQPVLEKSTDGGDTFTDVSLSTSAIGISYFCEHHSKTFVLINPQHIYSYTGTSWQKVTTGLPASRTVDRLFSAGEKLYATVYDQALKKWFLYSSDNDGAQWVKTDNNFMPEFGYVHDLAMTPGNKLVGAIENDKYAHAFLYPGLYTSLDFGASWQERNQGLYATTDQIAQVGNDLLLSSLHKGLFRSADGGETFGSLTNAPSGLPGKVHTYMDTVYLETHASPGTYPLLYRSLDHGDSWMPVTLPDSLTFFYDMWMNGGTLFIYSYKSPGYVFYRSADGGATWTAVTLPASVQTYGLNIVGNGSTMYLAALSTNGYTFLLYRSDDNGNTFVQDKTGLPGNPYIVGLSEAGSKFYVSVRTIQADYKVMDRIYVKNGAQWLPILNSDVSYVTYSGSKVEKEDFVYRNNDTLYAIMRDTVYVSGDEGNTWDLFMDNLPAGFRPSMLAFAGDKVFMATYENGVMRYGSAVPLNVEAAEKVNRMYTYPNPTTGKLNIGGNIAEGFAEVYDLMGKRIYASRFEPGGGEIDLSEYPKGTYLLRLVTYKQSHTSKIILK